jgi:hypothetical protein
MTYPTDNAYGRYLEDRRKEEDNFRSNSREYVRTTTGGQECTESFSNFGHCNRTDDHFTHEARAANGNILGRWRIRKQIEAVDPNIQLPE